VALAELGLFHDSLAAEMARGRLAAEGIESVLFGAGLASLGLGSMAPVRLMVEKDDLDEAKAVLAELG
jgi:hypothetical protein